MNGRIDGSNQNANFILPKNAVNSQNILKFENTNSKLGQIKSTTKKYRICEIEIQNSNSI